MGVDHPRHHEKTGGVDDPATRFDITHDADRPVFDHHIAAALTGGRYQRATGDGEGSVLSRDVRQQIGSLR